MKAWAITILWCVSTMVFAQQKDSDVPKKIIEGINKKYPHSTLTRFKKKRDSYVATFTWSTKKYVSTYAADGSWQKTETPILWKDLPGEVRTAYWKTRYRQCKMEGISQVETPKADTLFVFEVKDMGQFDPDERPIASLYAVEYLVYFNPGGEMIKEEKEE